MHVPDAVMKETSVRPLTIRYSINDFPLGKMLLAQDGTGICALLFGDDTQQLMQDLQQRFAHRAIMQDNTSLDRVAADILNHIAHLAGPVHVALNPQGTAFQQRVWQALQTIPPGKTLTYSALARQIGAPTSARAVAQACAANPIAFLIPCHRVVRSDGSLSGYRWGADRKRALLQAEAGGANR